QAEDGIRDRTVTGVQTCALPISGESTCTLGEARNRADLVVFWGSNPAESHPRHFERYSVWPAGRWVPRGRADRTVVVVDVQPTRSEERRVGKGGGWGGWAEEWDE